MPNIAGTNTMIHGSADRCGGTGGFGIRNDVGRRGGSRRGGRLKSSWPESGGRSSIRSTTATGRTVSAVSATRRTAPGSHAVHSSPTCSPSTVTSGSADGSVSGWPAAGSSAPGSSAPGGSATGGRAPGGSAPGRAAAGSPDVRAPSGVSPTAAGSGDDWATKAGARRTVTVPSKAIRASRPGSPAVSEPVSVSLSGVKARRTVPTPTRTHRPAPTPPATSRSTRPRPAPVSASAPMCRTAPSTRPLSAKRTSASPASAGRGVPPVRRDNASTTERMVADPGASMRTSERTPVTSSTTVTTTCIRRRPSVPERSRSALRSERPRRRPARTAPGPSTGPPRVPPRSRSRHDGTRASSGRAGSAAAR